MPEVTAHPNPLLMFGWRMNDRFFLISLLLTYLALDSHKGLEHLFSHPPCPFLTFWSSFLLVCMLARA